MKKLTVSGSSFFMHETYFHATEKINSMIICRSSKSLYRYGTKPKICRPGVIL